MPLRAAASGPATPRCQATRFFLFLAVALAACAPAFAQTGSAVPTYAKDIAPILFAKCAMCHHPNGPAPFSVLTYAAVRAQASQIAAVTSSGLMPPWKADEDPSNHWVGQARLTDNEKARIASWAANGAPEGNARDLPRAPAVAEGWRLGPPDLVVTLPKYVLPPEGTDVFRIFVVPIPTDQVKYVRGLEFRPGNGRVVHHANIRIDETPASRRFDAADPAPGYEGLIAHSAKYPDGYFLGWTPGQVSPLLDTGMGWRLQGATDLVVEVHMQPSGRPEDVQPSIGFYFGTDPPARTPTMIRLGRQGIDIAPGDAHYEISDRFVLPVDVDVVAVQPHAHYRAREVWGDAVLPDGTSRRLIHVANWDFRWQHVFRYESPIALPKGTALTMRYVYDNSAENPRNPVQPPRRVYWGQRSADEMGDLWIQVLTKNETDRAQLEEPLSRKIMAEDVIGYERWIQSEPKSAALHDDVGMLYLQLGRPDAAVRHFSISAGMQPASAGAHFNLGTALSVAGQNEAAIRELERAVTLDPDHAGAHNNLGGLLTRAGRVGEALPHLITALRLDPDNVQANYNAGVASQQVGQYGEALRYFRRALSLQPDFPALVTELAWLLAVVPDARLRDPVQALRLAEQLVRLTDRKNAVALDVLGAALAAAGRFDEAVTTIDAALALGPPNPAATTERRRLYAARQPYHLSEPR